MKFGIRELALSPAPEPLFSLDEAKHHLRVDYDYDDDLIRVLTAAATRQAELYVGRSFVTKPYLLTLEGYPTNRQSWGWPMQDGQVNPTRFGSSGQATRYPQAIYLPFAPLVAVQEIRHYAGEDDAYSPPVDRWQVLPAADYTATTAMEPAYVVPRGRRSWPQAAQHPEAVQVRYTAGYGGPADVPGDYVAATKLILGHLYEHREDVTPGVGAPQPAVLPYGARYMLGLTRVRLP